MKKIIYIAMVTLLSTVAYAQKPNLDKLPEKERNAYLLKTALTVVMKYAPEWYNDNKEPQIITFVMDLGEDKGRRVYTVAYPQDLQKNEKMIYSQYSVAVGFWADTGEVWEISFGDGLGYRFSKNSKTRSDDSQYYRANPYLKK